MDTQRLILFVIFSFSALFLWEAWQRDNRPPPAVGQAGRDRRPAHPAGDRAGAGTRAGRRRRSPGCRAPSPQRRAVPAAAQPIVVKTDLYTAEIDPVGGVITRVALTAHRADEKGSLPYNALVRNAGAHLRRAVRAARRRACPTTAPCTRCCPARASSPPAPTASR